MIVLAVIDFPMHKAGLRADKQDQSKKNVTLLKEGKLYIFEKRLIKTNL